MRPGCDSSKISIWNLVCDLALPGALTTTEIDATMTLVDTNGLEPTGVAATRIVSTGGRSTVLDGPFTESRELIGGYAIVEVDTFQQAVDASRKIIEFWPGWEGEAEVRQIMGADELPGG